jgi:exodeoxyribonuclease V beta subunit
MVMVMEPFDLRGPLPSGTTLLEASAGTGKTYTVGALVARYVAEGHASLDQLLVITFGRAASQELRERVRGALVRAERALARPAYADRGDAVVDLLLDAAPDEVARRHARLRDALAAFDGATIATTHQFCQLVLRSLGVAGDADTGATLVEDLTDLVEEVVDDLYLARYANLPSPPPFDRRAALRLAARAVQDAHARLVPDDLDPETAGGARVAFADAVRREVERRKRLRGLLSYDDLLGRLAAALEADDAPARERMRRRWQVVLVDEFQDTDPVQWQILDRAFRGHARIVLVGDPKQAIYAFRGGDVVTYLAAAEAATSTATLGTNRRSDGALVERLQAVLRGAALGDPRILVHPVTAAHEGSRLRGAPSPSPFRIRVALRPTARGTDGRGGRATTWLMDHARRHVVTDCAADIARLLRSGATYDGRPVRAADVAVLVRERKQGEWFADALGRLGVPAVVGGSGHVLLAPAGEEWRVLLEALEQPHRTARVRACALTCFFGETPASLVAGADDLTDAVADTLRGWALLVRGQGVAALVEAAQERGLGARVLAREGGERLLTDLRHIGQLLHEVSLREGLGLAALVSWLRAERRRTAAAAERTRRLDSDAAAVQVVTVHGSKGLQYPVVYLPFAFEKFPFEVTEALFHDAAAGRCLDVSGEGPLWAGHAERHRAEESGEELRELYVALTRAQSQVVAWWVPTKNTPTGGLHRVLFGRHTVTAEPPDVVPLPRDEVVVDTLRALEAHGGPTVEPARPSEVEPLPPPPAPLVGAARPFDRVVDTQWRRTSYSALLRAGDHAAAGVFSEPEQEPKDDETSPGADEPGPVVPGVPSPEAVAISPMAGLPAGAALGSLVHAVLEHADPDAPDLAAELTLRAAEQLRWWPVGVDAPTLAEALLPAHHSPLGPLAPGLTLARIPLRDRLRELDFEFPLAGGDLRGAVAPVWVRGLGAVLREHLPVDDPLADYAGELERPALGEQVLRGYLSGSIDAVLRVGGADPRFVVVDYKTNLLGEPGRPVTSADYGRDALAAAMLHAHYPLQALLYCVVLHRYLRWRLPDYEPERHLGGVAYLFLRGMCGPGTPVLDGHPAGVFSWRPPAGLVTAASDLLAGGGRR